MTVDPTTSSTRSGSFARAWVASRPPVIELSVVMPCLDEVATVAACITKARRALDAAGIVGEIIVADNGSTDGSQALAESLGARVITVATRGYGSAIMGGIAAARGRYVLVGDADGSYDFGELPKFVTRLREGYDLVQGCRLPRGGGTVTRGAMPPLSRLGGPMLGWLVRRRFDVRVHDVPCGMRAFTRELYPRLGQRCTGVEFAAENTVRASQLGVRIAEVPITLHRDGRPTPPSRLRPARDAWHHVRLALSYSPRWLMLVPSALLVGTLGYALGAPRLVREASASHVPAVRPAAAATSRGH